MLDYVAAADTATRATGSLDTTTHATASLSATMSTTASLDAATDVTVSLDAIVQAYAAGDAPYGEILLVQALDNGLPWDQVCAAAARGIARRYGEEDRV